jgi:hypothetical protein
MLSRTSSHDVITEKAMVDKEQGDTLNLTLKQVTESAAVRSVNSSFRPTQDAQYLQSSVLKGKLSFGCSFTHIRLTCSRKQLKSGERPSETRLKGFGKRYYITAPKNVWQ